MRFDPWADVLRPLAFRVDPERAHEAAGRLLDAVERSRRARTVVEGWVAGGDGRLGVRALGISFGSVLGVAGGFDKDARWVQALGALGFGHVEVGTITPRPQPGNPRPRIFRLSADRALVNRMGFPSAGAEAVARRLAALPAVRLPVLASLGKNKDTAPQDAARDYAESMRSVVGHVDAVTINVSSPNTPGLRDLGVGRALESILDAIAAESRRHADARGGAPIPVLLKLSPDLADSDLVEVVDLALAKGVAGFVAVNTTLRRDALVSPAWLAREAGGLSGLPLAARAREVVRAIRRRAGDGAVIVGVGGVHDGESAYRLIRAGATLVQAYTGFVYGGPSFARDVKAELRALLARDGFASVADAVGVDT
ncbi:MAG: quinone-dependent dihydroorotate dehydrogenase [bacterium]